MFGKNLGKTRVPQEKFDLENDLKDPAKLRKIQESLATNIQKLKNLQRQGGSKKDFDDTQKVLNGMVAVQKIVNRINRK